jgi:hypothetical protein
MPPSRFPPSPTFGDSSEFICEFAALEPPPELQQLFGRFTATRRAWMDLENTAAIFAAAAKKAHSVAATAESI